MLDVAIVGGGPAGMSAALMAGRSRLRTAIFNEEKPRNRVTAASHGFLTRDGVHPLQLLQTAREQLRKYPTVAYHLDGVVTVERTESAFRLRLTSGGEVLAAHLVIATGHRDDLDGLRLPGIHDVYGKSVFPCPFCDAYEHSGERLAVFGGAGIEHFAPIVKMWSDDVALFTNGHKLTAEAKEPLARNSVTVHESKVLGLESKDGRLLAVRLEDARVERDAGFLWDQPGIPATRFADDLGVRRTTSPRGIPIYEADDMGATNVPRVFVVGDLRSGFSKIAGAASDGARCIERIVRDIALERWR